MNPRVFSTMTPGSPSVPALPRRRASFASSISITGATTGFCGVASSLAGGVGVTLARPSGASSARTMRTPAGKRSRVIARQIKPAAFDNRFQSTGRVVTWLPQSGSIENDLPTTLAPDTRHRVYLLTQQSAKFQFLLSQRASHRARSVQPRPLATLSAPHHRHPVLESAVISRPSQRWPRRRTPVRRGRHREKLAKRSPPGARSSKCRSLRLPLARGVHTLW